MSLIEGDLTYTDYQYEFNGYLAGSDTDMLVEKVSGLLGTPAVRNNDQDRLNDHGSTPGVSTYGKRTVSMDGYILGVAGEDIEEKIQAANRAFQLPRKRLRTATHMLVFGRPGQPRKFVNGRCERREIVSQYDTAKGKAAISVDIVCTDPLIYSLEEYEVELTLAIGQTNGQIEVWHGGDLEDGAAPIIEIDGPATDAIITNATDDNREIKLDGDIAADEEFVFDLKYQDASLNGDPAFVMVRNDSQYWRLLPGRNVIAYQRTGSAAISRLRIRWRDTWQ